MQWKLPNPNKTNNFSSISNEPPITWIEIIIISLVISILLFEIIIPTIQQKLSKNKINLESTNNINAYNLSR